MILERFKLNYSHKNSRIQNSHKKHKNHKNRFFCDLCVFCGHDLIGGISATAQLKLLYQKLEQAL